MPFPGEGLTVRPPRPALPPFWIPGALTVGEAPLPLTPQTAQGYRHSPNPGLPQATPRWSQGLLRTRLRPPLHPLAGCCSPSFTL